LLSATENFQSLHLKVSCISEFQSVRLHQTESFYCSRWWHCCRPLLTHYCVTYFVMYCQSRYLFGMLCSIS